MFYFVLMLKNKNKPGFCQLRNELTNEKWLFLNLSKVM